MDSINFDAKVAREGRKSALKDSDNLQVTAPLRDQVVSKLKAKLDKENFGAQVVAMWHRGNATRREWLERQREYLSSYDEFLVSTDNGPFEGSSTLHLPMPVIVAKTLHARFLQALVGSDPMFQVKARNPAIIDRQDVIEDLMSYTLKDWANEYDGAIEAIDKWVWDWITVGSSILKIRWDVQFERYTDVETVPVAGAPSIQMDDQGNDIIVPTITSEEQEVEKEDKIFEGPNFRVVNLEDIIVVEGEGDPQKSDAVIERSYVTASDLWTAADRKVFDKKVVNDIVKGSPDKRTGGENSDIKYDRMDHAGQDSLDRDYDLSRYEILEAHVDKDVYGSGINSKIVVWVHLSTQKILGCSFLRRMHKCGKRPYFKVDFHKRREAEHGIGIIEMMYPLSVELDAIHNMRIDFGILATMPFGFYRPTSSIDPETISLEPGVLIPVDNPQTDIYFPNVGNKISFGYQEEQGLMNMIDKLVGLSDINYGLTSSQGAARTATGARALIGEASANLDVHLRRLNLGWKHALKFLFAMLQQRLPDGISFRVTSDDGKDIWRRIETKEAISGFFDFEVDSNSTSSNQQIRIANADFIAQMQQNMIAIQLGIVQPANLYEGMKNQLRVRGIKDINKWITPPQQQRMMTPKEVVDRTLLGVNTPANINDDHEGIINYIQELLDNAEIMGTFLPGDAQALAAKQAEHIQMLQALQQMAAQQRNLAQMNLNAAQSEAQTNPQPATGQINEA